MKTKLFRIPVILAIVLFVSCVKKPGDNPGPTPPEPPVDETAKTVDDLVITEFGVFPAQNDRIYIPINFIVKNGSGYVFTGTQEIRHYKTSVNALKASFSSNASKVTVGTVTQSSGVTVNNFANQLTYRFHALDGNYKEYKVQLSNPAESYSGLPVLVLATNDGSAITSKEVWKPAGIRLDRQLDQSVAEYTGETNIRGRGNSTWGMPKKPYALQLKNKDGLMGMPAQKRWAVLANYADKTLLRNKVSLEIAKRTGLAWSSDSRFVEVIVNGVFHGNCLLTEQIRRDPNRVAIKETDATATGDDINGGYLMEIDRYNTGEPGYFRLTRSQLPIVVKDPEPMSSAQIQYITGFLNSIEEKLYKEVPDSLEYYQDIDIGSFIDYWIVMELAGNRDIRLPGSFYMYKDVNKKLCAGPVWDFDQTTFLGDNEFMLADYDRQPGEAYYELYKCGSLWFGKLFKDPKFKARAKARWNELYGSNVFHTIPAFIDQQAAYIQKSAYMNWQPTGLWELNIGSSQTTGRNLDEELDWLEAVGKMKTNYNKRLTRLNTIINAL